MGKKRNSLEKKKDTITIAGNAVLSLGCMGVAAYLTVMLNSINIEELGGSKGLGKGTRKDLVLPKGYSFECPQKGLSNLVILMFIFSIPHLNPESSTQFAIKY